MRRHCHRFRSTHVPMNDDVEHKENGSVIDITDSPTQMSDASAPGTESATDSSLENDSASDDSDGDEEEEEDDDEPALKYERIAGNLPDILKPDSKKKKTDAASALATAKEMMVRCTRQSLIHSIIILTFQTGNGNTLGICAYIRPVWNATEEL